MKQLFLLLILVVILISCEKETTEKTPSVVEVPSTTTPTVTEKSVETTPSEVPKDYNDLQTADDTFNAIDESLNYIK